MSKKLIVHYYRDRFKHIHSNAEQSQDNDSESDSWLITYTDLITLLLVLFISFVVLLPVQKGEEQQDAPHLKHDMPAQRQEPVEKVPDPPLFFDLNQRYQGSNIFSLGQEDHLGIVRRSFNLHEDETGLDGDLKVRSKDGSMRMLIRTPVTFNFHKSSFTNSGRELLVKLAPILLRMNEKITIAGSANDFSGVVGQQHEAWKIAALRATNVAKFLIEKGVNSELITVVVKPLETMESFVRDDKSVPAVVISVVQ